MKTGIHTLITKIKDPDPLLLKAIADPVFFYNKYLHQPSYVMNQVNSRLITAHEIEDKLPLIAEYLEAVTKHTNVIEILTREIPSYIKEPEPGVGYAIGIRSVYYSFKRQKK